MTTPDCQRATIITVPGVVVTSWRWSTATTAASRWSRNSSGAPCRRAASLQGARLKKYKHPSIYSLRNDVKHSKCRRKNFLDPKKSLFINFDCDWYPQSYKNGPKNIIKHSKWIRVHIFRFWLRLMHRFQLSRKNIVKTAVKYSKYH